MKNTYQRTQLWLRRCCAPSFKQLFVLALALFSTTLLMGQAANDDCANAIPLTVGDCPANEVAGDTGNATDDGFFSCDATGQNAGLWYSFVAPASGEVLLSVTDGGPGNPEAAVFDGCGGTEVWCNGAPDFSLVSGLTAGSTYFVVVWGDVTAGQGPFTICVDEFVPPTNDFCADAISVPVGADGDCPGNAVTYYNLGATDDGPQSCDGTTNNMGVWFSFVAPASGAVNLQVIDLGPGDPEAAIYDGCGGTSIWCDGTPDDEVVNGLTAGSTYYLLVWGDIGSFQGPFGLCIQEFVPITNDICATATPIPVGANGSCPGAAATYTNLGASDDGPTSSCDGTTGNYGVWFSFVAPASGGISIDIIDLGPGDQEAAIYDGCGGNEVWCESFPSGPEIVGGLIPGATYYLIVWSDGTTLTGSFDMCIEEFMPPPGDNCGNAQDLATLTSPYSSTTSGYSDDEDVSCLNASVDHIFYIDVPSAATLTISTPTDTYDSRHRVAYGGACPGDNEIDCIDDPDNQVTTWINTTGMMQRVYWVQEAFSTTTSGDFTLEWDLVLPPPVPNDDCADAEPIACGETVSGTTLGANIDAIGDCGTEITGPGVWYTFTAGTIPRFYSLSTCNQAGYDTKISVFTGDVCGELTCLAGADDTDGCSGGSTELIFTPSLGRVHYVLVHGFGQEQGAFDLTLDCDVEAIPTGCTDPTATNYDPDALVDDGSCVYAPAPTGNDDCAGAIAVSCGQTVSGSTTGATFDGVGTCGTSNTAPGVWYTVVGNGDLITASTCNQASFDTKISIFTGSCGSLSCLQGDDDDTGCGLTTTESWLSTPGVTYYILIHGFGTAAGDFDLTVTCAPPPAGDDCATATPITVAPPGGCPANAVFGSTIGASDDGPQSPCDGTTNNIGVWYSFTAPASGIVNLNIVEITGNHEAAIYTGCGGASVFCDITPNSELITGLTPGATYYLIVWSDAGLEGDHSVCIEEIIAPDNDNCADAIELSCNTTVTGSTTFASPDAAPTCDGQTVTAPGVWYTFVATTRSVNVNTCGSNFDTKISVYSGGCGGELVCVAGNDDYCGTQSSVSFVPDLGQRYYVLVHGFGSATGSFHLEYDCENPIPRPQGTTPVVTDDGISLFPNPAQDELNVKLNAFPGDKATLSVHNSLGQLMMERRIDQVELPVERLNTSQLQSGLYFLTVDVEGKGRFTKKFMIGSSRP
ncbi:MAG: T9SS type A sorting domain-containing protein [Lewinellaceae bacterium]|nr:T9SS type A sorting domain-containing protein [Lewinellaceae bacterium]